MERVAETTASSWEAVKAVKVEGDGVDGRQEEHGRKNVQVRPLIRAKAQKDSASFTQCRERRRE